MNPLISIIVPVYNTEKYLKKCIDSVLAQTIKNIEVLIVDDGSTDSSSRICEEYKRKDRRIRVIHKKNGGLSSARNAGLKAATGNYLSFVDSDDYISETMYEELLQALNEIEEKNAIACSKYVRVDEEGIIIQTQYAHEKKEIIKKDVYLRELLLHKGDVSVCTKLFPKHIIHGHYFAEDRLNEDLLFMVELLPLIDRIVFTGKVAYYYLTRFKSISSGYGKAVIDMASNAVMINDMVQCDYPSLKNEGNRFALYQNMAYLLLVPSNQRNRDNRDYFNAIRYVHSNFLKNGITNQYLSVKNKIVIVGLLVWPDIVIEIYQRRHKK